MSNNRNRHIKSSFSFLAVCILVFIGIAMGMNAASAQNDRSSQLQLATFDFDVTPPVGHDLSQGPILEGSGGVPFTKSWDLGLRAKGIVLLGAGEPIVLLAVDWLSIRNKCHDEFRHALANAVGTTPQRVAVHVLHQHDAPRCGNNQLNHDFVESVINNLVIAAKKSLEETQPITHIGLGKAEVFKLASNRRILGANGDTVRVGRMTTTRDPEVRAEPEGIIDPEVSMVSFWNTEDPVAVLSFYATHPQSYYQTGVPNPDIPGIARFFRQLEVPDALHVHFTGAGGNVGAGKYNDGSHENRGILANRLADGMKRAWKSTERHPITADSVAWYVKPVALPADTTKERSSVERYKIDLQSLALNKARILFMPAELFVEYQLEAKKMRPDLFVMMAAYGDGGPGYIPTAAAFPRGGYEVRAAGVTPEAEKILMEGLGQLLNAEH